jgi:uncharacterized protein DUF2752
MQALDRAADEQRSTRAARAWILGLLGLASALALTLSLVYAPEAMAAGAPARLLEPWVALQPHPCPGCPLCGMSRAFSAASHLELARAVHFNRGVLLAYPVALATAVAGPWILVRHLLSGRAA